MKKTFAIGLVALLVLSGCTYPPTDGNGTGNSNFEVRYKIYGGFVPFEMAEQEMIVKGDGTIQLITTNGDGLVVKTETKTISNAQVEELKALIEKGGFWNLNDEYNIPEGGPIVIDAGNLDITVVSGLKTKKVSVIPYVDYAVPQSLKPIISKFNDYFELFQVIVAPEDKIWVSYEPVQCGTNPWEVWWNEGGSDQYGCKLGQQCKELDEGQIITKYFENEKGIELFDIRISTKYEIVCEACSCPRGDEVQVLVNAFDLQEMFGLGWKEAGGNSGGIVAISTDKSQYAGNETIKVTIINNSNEVIFFGGCNDFSIQEFDPPYVARIQQWNDRTLSVCVWEGIPTKLEAGSSVERTLNLESDGTYRLVLDYGVGCTEGKPMSQADCSETTIVYSEEFTFEIGTASLECITDSDCAVGGCSSQVCTTKELAPAVVTTCEYRSEYACLGLAGCGCISNKCQWDTEKPAYQQCIADLPDGGNTGPV